MAAVAFTGGKDSMLALHLVCGHDHHLFEPQNEVPPVTLLVTFAPDGADFKAHPLPIIQSLAAALQLPHVTCTVSSPFLESYRQQLRWLYRTYGITHLVTGDRLDVAAGFMESAVCDTGVHLVRPLWHCHERAVLTALHDLRIHSKISCVDLSKYGAIQTDDADAVPRRGAEGPQNSSQQQSHRPHPPGYACTQQTAPEPGHCSAAAAGLQSEGPEPASPVEGVPAACAHSRAPYVEGFNAVELLLGKELTTDVVEGPLAAAAHLFGADMCGERGEYHTLVFEAPMCTARLQLEVAERQTVEASSGSQGARHAYIVWRTC